MDARICKQSLDAARGSLLLEDQTIGTREPVRSDDRKIVNGTTRWLGAALLLVFALCRGTAWAQYTVCPITPGGALCTQTLTLPPSATPSDAANINYALQKCSGSLTQCTVQLGAGVYNLTAGLQIPSNTTLTSLTSQTSAVILSRDWRDAGSLGANMGPLISMVGVHNATVSYLSVNGQDHPPYPVGTNDVNIHIQHCGECTVQYVDSSHARTSSIFVDNANQSVAVDHCTIHDNGWPGADPSAVGDLKSDGLTVLAVTGISNITNNQLWNNTDVDLILGGGMYGIAGNVSTCNAVPTGSTIQSKTIQSNIADGFDVYSVSLPLPNAVPYLGQSSANNCTYVVANTILPNQTGTYLTQPPLSVLQLDQSGLTGAGIAFDTENNWTPGCGNDCGDFTGFVVKFNINHCGPDCGIGIAVGTHMSNNWGQSVSPTCNDVSAGQALSPQGCNNYPVINLALDNTNKTDRLTIDYTGDYTDPGSVVDPTIDAPVAGTNACWYSSGSQSYPRGACQPCTGGQMCATPGHDSGYVLPVVLSLVPYIPSMAVTTSNVYSVTIPAQVVTVGSVSPTGFFCFTSNASIGCNVNPQPPALPISASSTFANWTTLQLQLSRSTVPNPPPVQPGSLGVYLKITYIDSSNVARQTVSDTYFPVNPN